MISPRPFRMEVISDEDAAMLRRLGGTGRLRLLDKLNRASRALIMSKVRAEHPEWDAERCNAESRRRWAANGTV